MQYSKESKQVAWSYFLVHALVELVCFSIVFRKPVGILIALLFDYFAFVPQALVGQLNHRFRKLDIGSIGVGLMVIGLLGELFQGGALHSGISIVLLAVGNAMLHVAGACATTQVSEGKLAGSALFVAGGSFGLVIGQTLAHTSLNLIWMLLPLFLIWILVHMTNPCWLQTDKPYPRFQLTKPSAGMWVVVWTAFLVTTARSFLGYAIPISWKKELWQSFALFFCMGAGKAVGGLLSDRYGARRVGVLSTLSCIPFLLFGDHVMMVSIVGVFLFSLTMSITFGMLLTVIEDNAGLAFGVTTLALFLGIVPMIFRVQFSLVENGVLIVVLSLASAFGLHKTLK